MNQQQVVQWAGNDIFLTSWPWTIPINTAEGKQYMWRNQSHEKRKLWKLLKLTKGGMAMITDGEHTFSVPPRYLTHSVWVNE